MTASFIGMTFFVSALASVVVRSRNSEVTFSFVGGETIVVKNSRN